MNETKTIIIVISLTTIIILCSMYAYERLDIKRDNEILKAIEALSTSVLLPTECVTPSSPQ